MATVPGGFTEEKDATPEIQVITIQVKSAVEAKTNEKYEHFTAVKYKRQVVAGMNYLIKVYVGGVNYVHLLVFEALPSSGGGLQLRGVQEHKTRGDACEPFNN